jgi:2-(1,2-epoxy-1,2-dihydrophenyl)acetyl-CoA isomerase
MQDVRIDIEDHVAVLTLNRPEQGNALNPSLVEALLAAATQVAQDDAVRCVILTGAGKLFCGGGDISFFATQKAASASAIPSNMAEQMHMAIAALLHMPKPLITLINGPAAGAGMSFALCGDMVIASEAAHFTCAYAGIGLTPDGGMSWLLPRLIGLRHAQRLLLLNERVGAHEALTLNMVSAVVPQEQLMPHGKALAQRFIHMPVKALGGARKLLLTSFTNTLEAQLELEDKSISFHGAQAEAQEGISAFLAKRLPDYKGI